MSNTVFTPFRSCRTRPLYDVVADDPKALRGRKLYRWNPHTAAGPVDQ